MKDNRPNFIRLLECKNLIIISKQKINIAIWILLLGVLLLCFINGCTVIIGALGGDPAFATSKVRVLENADSKLQFKILSKYKFGFPTFSTPNLLGGFGVYTGSVLGELSAVWELEIHASPVPKTKRIELITYGINPDPEMLRENISPQSLEKNVLYSAGYGELTFFKIIDDPKWGTVILQGDKLDNLKDLDH